MRQVARMIVLAAAAALALASPAAAQDALTPDGPATVRSNWLGPSTAEGRPPEILIGWTATVLPGGNGGPVRLRVLRPGVRGTVVGSGPPEWLPSVPGTYTYPLPLGIPYDYRDSGLALDQRVGGHAIVRAHPPDPAINGFDDLSTLDVFRPVLAEDAADAAYSERSVGRELLVRGIIEADVDRDLLGDVTQDVGDLRLLDARIVAVEREAVSGFGGRVFDRALIAARVRNTGATVRHMPHFANAFELAGWSCARTGRPDDWLRCAGTPIRPGEEAELRIWTYREGGPPARVAVASEGPDLSPEDNAGPVRPLEDPGPPARLRVRALAGRDLRARVMAAATGTATLRARVAGLSIRRTLRFRAPGTRTARLIPGRARDRRRLAAARRRPGRLRATITATMGTARAHARTTLP